jgi:hypothetical protein
MLPRRRTTAENQTEAAKRRKPPRRPPLEPPGCRTACRTASGVPPQGGSHRGRAVCGIILVVPAESVKAADLVGHWSHGIAHENYYGGSHEYAFVLLPDGRGSYTHDGWLTYRFASFRWRIDENTLVLSEQRFRIFHSMGHEQRCLQVEGALSLTYDTTQGRERLDIPLVDEPKDFYLVSRDVSEADLKLEYLAGDTQCNRRG